MAKILGITIFLAVAAWVFLVLSQFSSLPYLCLAISGILIGAAYGLCIGYYAGKRAEAAMEIAAQAKKDAKDLT